MSVVVGKYHLYKRTTAKGSHYYYWYEENGKRVPKACGRTIETKREAVAYLEELYRLEVDAAKKAAARKAKKQQTTLKQFASGIFIEGSRQLIRWEAKGKVIKRNTLKQHQQHLEHYLLPKFGSLPMCEIRPAMVEDHLLDQRLSNSCRNTIIYTLKVILREALREELIDMVPEFEPFKRNGRKQDVLSGEELQALFPSDPQELIKVWRRPAGMKKEPDEIALMFGTMFCLTVSAGLRSGEIRALHRDQISLPHSGLVIDVYSKLKLPENTKCCSLISSREIPGKN